MKNVWAIYRKEMGHYFVSPIAYVVVGAFLFVSGLLFTIYLQGAIQQAMQMQMEGMQYGMTQNFDIPSEVLRAFLSVQPILLLIIIPMLTMGVFAEERKRGTIELLMTSPITELDIVLGKFLGLFSLFFLMVLPTLIYMTFMYLHSDPMPPWPVLLAGYLGLLLFGGSLVALGSFISSLTENQIIAAVLTFAIFFVLWIFSFVFATRGSATANTVVSYFSVIQHYEDFPKGVIDTTSLVYYGSFIFLFVFLTIRSVDSMRWRRA
jgi:ABC-2 type transport system permease protein